MLKRLNFSNIHVFKILTTLALFFCLVFTINLYINYKYNKVLDSFYTQFNNCDFESAKETLTNNKILITLKSNSLNEDLSDYFTSIIELLCTNLQNNTIAKDSALPVFYEINDYNIIDSSLTELIIYLDSSYTPTSTNDCESFIDLANYLYNKDNFYDAICTLNRLSQYTSDYSSEIETLILKYQDGYKNYIFAEADSLISNDYYTKAIDILSNIDTNIIDSEDSDIQLKIASIESLRDEYLAEINSGNNTVSSSNFTQTITITNINSLNLTSNTNNLIYVNLDDQYVYVYEGSTNDWTLENYFLCSTGIEGSETPEGVYSILSRGEWFFSDEYGEGGKYWLQFLGNYLFHSVPYDEDQTEILDDTLGVAASHGCIRLSTSDAKWLYDNILDGTKVIIN